MYDFKVAIDYHLSAPQRSEIRSDLGRTKGVYSSITEKKRPHLKSLARFGWGVKHDFRRDRQARGSTPMIRLFV